ncbi:MULTISPECIES: amine oxidase [unclassified Pseudoalteromonas]|uniref:amine oxidase n=1 Tax=unclassified Pseudoalteromonas TaxID=194690 RepID=UPI0019D2BF2B|nr:amine oxidase [Pseudoalteromonas sp. JC3]MBR8845623.1 amine oxidase [Pseudoalteromonas sp. JC3]WJE08832.1 amine oxidase [Pseudoalteromonas sp. JC3]
MLRKILLGVGPWVVFSLVLRFGTMELINVAWIVFFVLHTYFGRHYLKAGNPLSWVSSLLFLILFANGIFGWSYWALQYGAQICYGVFAITALVTVMVNKPFTLTHSKLVTPQEFWGHPIFLKTNQHVSLFWAASFALNGVVMMFEVYYPWASLITTYLVLTSAIVFSDLYPIRVREKAMAMRAKMEAEAQQQAKMKASAQSVA